MSGQAGRRAGSGAVVTGSAVACPPGVAQEALWEGYFASHFQTAPHARAVFSASGVTTRHAALDPRVEDVADWSTGKRMERFAVEATPLGKAAMSGALEAAGIGAEDLGLLAVVTCTGYGTPGVDIVLARDMGLRPSALRLSIGHVGCHAALPGLGAVADFVTAHGAPAALICLELPSLHVQPPTDDLEQVVVHALFGDAAAAIVVEPNRGHDEAGGLEVVEVVARSELAAADQMTWQVTDRGFRMTLSRKVPEVVGRHVGPLVEELLGRHGLERGAIAHWAVHPGGPRILDVVADRLDLGDGALDASRRVLATHGNCSSATVLVVLEELRRTKPLGRGDHVVLLAFGPGLTLYGALLRAT